GMVQIFEELGFSCLDGINTQTIKANQELIERYNTSMAMHKINNEQIVADSQKVARIKENCHLLVQIIPEHAQSEKLAVFALHFYKRNLTMTSFDRKTLYAFVESQKKSEDIHMQLKTIKFS